MEADINIKTELGVVDKRILETLGENDNQTTYQVAKDSQIAWNTAKTHCLKLQNIGKVINNPQVFFGGNKKDFWSLVKENPLGGNQD